MLEIRMNEKECVQPTEQHLPEFVYEEDRSLGSLYGISVYLE